MHVIAGVAILHPVVGCRGDDEENVPDSSAEQPTSHEAVHPAKKKRKKKLLAVIQKKKGRERVRTLTQAGGPPAVPIKAGTSCDRAFEGAMNKTSSE